MTDDTEVPLPTAEQVKEHIKTEGDAYLRTAVLYVMRQGMPETQVRRVTEAAINERRNGGSKVS